MKLARPTLICLALLLVSTAAGAKQADRPAAAPAIENAAWLAGSWRAEKAGRVTEEVWMKPAGGSVLGVSRVVAKGRELEHEFRQIREGPGGELYLVVSGTGHKEVALRLTASADGSLAFENRDNDYPQVVTFALQPENRLLVAYEGVRGGTSRRLDYLCVRTTP